MVRGQNLRFARSSLSASGLRFRRIAKEQALAEFYVPIQKGLVERRLSHGALNFSRHHKDAGRRAKKYVIKMSRVSFHIAAKTLRLANEVGAKIYVPTDDFLDDGGPSPTSWDRTQFTSGRFAATRMKTR
jgi:uncharacterized protein (UPF0303 family)